MAKLGALVDPDKECKLVKNEQTHKVEITMPEKLFTLSPLLKRKGQPLHNAPMSLTDVEGDFLISVQVTGNMNPGTVPAKDPLGRTLPFTFQGAGLIVYQDKSNFFRLERACQSEGRVLVRELLVEVIRSGQVTDHYYIALPGNPSRRSIC